jgi:hypothetical protein
VTVSLRALIGKVNQTTRAALEAAAGLALSRTHYDVEIGHFLLKLLNPEPNDFALIVKRFGVDRPRLEAELSRSIDRLKTGSTRPSIGSTVIDALTNGWLYGSIECDATQIRTGFVVVALLSDDNLSKLVREFGGEMQKIDVQALRREFAAVVRDSAEGQTVPAAAPAQGGQALTGGPRVFISYRRDDSALYADFLFTCIRSGVPDVRVFRDSDTLQPGMVYSEKINETVGACDILVAVIGKKWLGAKETGGARRIDLPDDWVRLEIAAALQHKKLVIPCLVAGSEMPHEKELPPDLTGLAVRHALAISETDPGRDTERLIDQLRNWRRTA